MNLSPFALRLSTFLLSFAALAAHAQQPPPELPSGWTDKGIVYTHLDMVAAANPLAVSAGADILAQGGSAVDAAVAVQMVLGLVEPQSSGLGGGAFITTFTAAGAAVETYDGRETAPAKATPGYFLGANGQPIGFTQAVIGGLSTGVPGAVKALELAHREKGKLPWAMLFNPAIRLAEGGFPLSPRLFSALQGANAELKGPRGAGSYFYNADGTPKAIGTVLVNPEYAASLRAIAAGGADALLKGPIAQDIIAKIKGHPTNPGIMELTDLAGYAAKNVPRYAAPTAAAGASAAWTCPRRVRPPCWRRSASCRTSMSRHSPRTACLRCTSLPKPIASPTPTVRSTWPTRISSACRPRD